MLRITDQTEMAVVEMGANHPGEIAALASIALPDYGLVTNVGKAHIEGFGSFEGVKKTKGELYDYLQRTADTAFLNVDDDNLCGMASQRPDLRIVRYGVESAGVEILPVTAEEPYLRLDVPDGDGMLRVSTRLIGAYNAPNVMAALCVGQYFGIALKDAVAAVEAYVPSSSMKASLDNFSASRFPHKMVILGQMLELGPDSTEEHRKVMEKVAAMKDCERAVFVGEEFEKALAVFPVAEDVRFRFCHDVAAAREALGKEPAGGMSILMKGSNAVGLPSLRDLL